VLVVEDDHARREAISSLLRKAGMKVFVAGSAAEGVDAYKGTPMDLIISDIGMPGEDGYSMMRRIRQLEAESKKEPVPAVALTAFAREVDRQRAFEAGFQEYVSKPVDPRLVIAVAVRLCAAAKPG
jgi:CheY-like chemotaxis protein